MSQSLRLTRILLAALVLQGCVGIGVIGATRSDRELNDVFFGVDQPISIQAVIDRWGEPDEVQTAADGAEVWIYESGLRWAGLVACVVIPIPLIIPVGREVTSLSVRDGLVVSASRLAESTTLYVAGLVPGMCTEFGFGVYHR